MYIYKKVSKCLVSRWTLKDLQYPLCSLCTRGLGEIWDFKIDERQQNDCLSGGTAFEDFRVSKGLSSIRKTTGYKPRSHQKGLRKRPIPENEKTGTEEENFNLYFVQDGQKDDRKSLRRSKKSLLSAAMVQKHLKRSTLLLNDLKNHGNRIVNFSDKKTFTVDRLFNKQNDRGVTLRNNASEHRMVSTTKQPASEIRLWSRSIDGENMPPVWFERGYR